MSLLSLLLRQLNLTVKCWNYKAVQVNTASVYNLLRWYMYSKGTMPYEFNSIK